MLAIWKVFVESVFLGFSGEKYLMNHVDKKKCLLDNQAPLPANLTIELGVLPVDHIVSNVQPRVSAQT